MITILDENRDALAIIDKYVDDEIREVINGEYTLKFTCVMEDKSQYVAIGHYCEADGQLFNIVRHVRTRSPLGAAMIEVHCEQVSYELIDVVHERFIHAGTPAALLAMVLDDTGFTLGDVDVSGTISIDVKQETTAKGLLLEIAKLSDGELEYDGYTVHLRARRGVDRGVEFRLGKNLRGLTKDVSIQSGELITAYQVDIVELRELPAFGELEAFELGDTVFIVDEELGIDEEQRIVQYVYSPKKRINSSVTIAAAISGLQDQFYRLKENSVQKDKYMYGTRFGPEVGFESVRWDMKARGIFNADTFALQKGDGGGSWTNAVYFDTDDDEYAFTGIVRAAKFIGGEIQIGSAFSVNSSGHMKATGAEFSGIITTSVMTGGIVQTREPGNYPRVELSGLGHLIRVEGSANNVLSIQSDGGVPRIGMTDSTSNATTIRQSGGLSMLQTTQNMIIHAIAGSLNLLSTLGLININANAGVYINERNVLAEIDALDSGYTGGANVTDTGGMPMTLNFVKGKFVGTSY